MENRSSRGCHPLPGAIFFVTLLCLGSPAQPQEPGKKPAPPSPAAQKKAEELIRSIFKDDYARKTPDAQQALAKKLIQQARETGDDPVARYVLFREGIDLASKSGDAARALEAVDALGDLYEVDKLTLKIQALVDASGAIKAPEAAKGFAETCLKVIDAAVAADRPDDAKTLAGKAETAAKVAKDLGLVSRIQKQKKDLDALVAEVQKVKSAETTLQSSPDDPAANLSLGKYLFAKGTVDRALAHLTKGSDPALKAAAEKDLASPKEAQAQVQVGNAWWELAEKEKDGPYRKALQERARGWYEAAFPQTTGLARTALQKRLDAIAPLPTTPPTLRVISYAEFEAMASRFPQDQDLAAKSGKAAASGFYPDRQPENVFKGNRRSNAWSLDVASGWFEATWDPPVRGRTLIMVGRASEPRFDSWGNATLTLNGSIKLPVKEMAGSMVILVDLGSAGKLQSVRADIQGGSLPGLATVEVYR
jgi:hypothetical protein